MEQQKPEGLQHSETEPQQQLRLQAQDNVMSAVRDSKTSEGMSYIMEKIAQRESSVSSLSDGDVPAPATMPTSKLGQNNKLVLKNMHAKTNSFRVDARPTPKVNNCPTGEANSDQPNPPSNVHSRDVSRLEVRKQLINNIDDEPLPLAHGVAKGGSISVDMKLGWRPVNPYSGAPIPLYYAYGNYDAHINYNTLDPTKVPRFLGPRIPNSLQMHRLWAKKELPGGKQSYNFKFPPRIMNGKRKRVEEPRPFLGMNPNLPAIYERKGLTYNQDTELTFDSFFESGNLDIVQKPAKDTYNLYMRCDTNTSGNHQWFYFSVSHTEALECKTVTFNICNFTKHESLYSSADQNVTMQQQPPPGMKVIVSRQSENYQMKRAGTDHTYYKSNIVRRKHPSDPAQTRFYYQMTFTFEFKSCQDKVYFSYSYPYTFTKLSNFLKDLTLRPDGTPKQLDHFGQTTLCKSLSGVDVPILTVTSRILSDPLEYNKVKLSDFDDADSKVSIPLNRRKKFIVVTSRVHPGESNSSWMMHGFIKAIMGNSFTAQQLRKRIVFKIIPMLNVDGVIAGNYRSSMAGADLNRRYLNPDARLHPEICAVKELIGDLTFGRPKLDSDSNRGGAKKEPDVDEEDILCMLDMHGHSRKKNVFIYGPQYPLSSEKYYRSRLIPKLLSEETNKFRYHSCQFKYEDSKRKTARIVLNQEFDIMNCFTLEASFHAYFDSTRNNFEFTERDYEDMGEHLVNAFYEYCLITEEEERRRELVRMQKRKRKRQQTNSLLQKVDQVGIRQSKSLVKGSNQKPPKHLNKVTTESMSNKHSRHSKSRNESERGLNMNDKSKSDFDVDSNNEQVIEDGTGSPERKQRLGTDTDGVEEVSVGYLTSATHLKEDDTAVRMMESRGGVRNMKDLFKMLENDENRRHEEEQVEEQELGFKPDKDEDDAGRTLFEKGDDDDSEDLDDAELGGALKSELLEDICGTLNQFSKQYGGNTYYQAQEKRSKQRQKMMADVRKKKKKSQKQEDRASGYERQPTKKPSSKSASKRPSVSPHKNDREESKRLHTEISTKENKSGSKNERQNKTSMNHQSARESRNGPQRTSTEVSELMQQRKNQSGVKMAINSKVKDYSEVKSMVPGHNVYQKPKDNDVQVQLRIMQRQRLAQQGVMNRIGMKQQAGATKIIPLRKFLESKYQGSTDERVVVDTQEVQLTPQFLSDQMDDRAIQQSNEHIIGATPRFDVAQCEQTPQFARDVRPLDFTYNSPVSSSTRHGMLTEPPFQPNQKYEFPQGWKIAPPNLSAMQIIKTFKKQIAHKNALSDDVSFVMTKEHVQPLKSQMNMRSDQRVEEVRQSFASLQHQTWDRQQEKLYNDQRARCSVPTAVKQQQQMQALTQPSPLHGSTKLMAETHNYKNEKANSANLTHTAAMTAQNFRKHPDRYTQKMTDDFVFNPTHTFGDEFLLAGLIDQQEQNFGKKPSYYSGNYPQTQKITQAKAPLPLSQVGGATMTNHKRGNGSLPEIMNSPPDSSWGQARISHVSHPKVETYRGRMAIFEGLKICEQQTADADLSGIGSPLMQPQQQRLPTGQRQHRAAAQHNTERVGGHVTIGQAQNWPRQQVETGERQLGGTKSMMKAAVGNRGLKLEVHKQNTKDLQAVKMRLPQRSQIDSILNHQNRNGGNFFQSVETRVQGTYQDDTVDSQSKLRASIEGHADLVGPKWLNQGTRVLPSQAQVQQARGIKAATRRQQSERRVQMRHMNQVRATGQNKKSRRDTENIQIYAPQKIDEPVVKNPRRILSMNIQKEPKGNGN